MRCVNHALDSEYAKVPVTYTKNAPALQSGFDMYALPGESRIRECAGFLLYEFHRLGIWSQFALLWSATILTKWYYRYLHMMG